MGQPRRQHIWRYTGTAGHRHGWQVLLIGAAILATKAGQAIISVLREFLPSERPTQATQRPPRSEQRQPSRRAKTAGLLGLSWRETLVLAVALPVAAAFLLLLAKHILPLALVLLLALLGGLWLELRRRSRAA